MSSDPTITSSNSDQTTTEISTIKSKLTTAKPKTKVLQKQRFYHWGHVCAGLWATAAAIATGMNWQLVQKFEYDIQNSYFFE